MCLKKKLQLWAVPVKNGTGYPALVSADAVLLLNVVDVGSNVVLGKLFRIEVVVIGENIAHLGHIVAHGHRRIGLCFEK